MKIVIKDNISNESLVADALAQGANLTSYTNNYRGHDVVISRNHKYGMCTCCNEVCELETKGAYITCHLSFLYLLRNEEENMKITVKCKKCGTRYVFKTASKPVILSKEVLSKTPNYKFKGRWGDKLPETDSINHIYPSTERNLYVKEHKEEIIKDLPCSSFSLDNITRGNDIEYSKIDCNPYFINIPKSLICESLPIKGMFEIYYKFDSTYLTKDGVIKKTDYKNGTIFDLNDVLYNSNMFSESVGNIVSVNTGRANGLIYLHRNFNTSKISNINYSEHIAVNRSLFEVIHHCLKELYPNIAYYHEEFSILYNPTSAFRYKNLYLSYIDMSLTINKNFYKNKCANQLIRTNSILSDFVDNSLISKELLLSLNNFSKDSLKSIGVDLSEDSLKDLWKTKDSIRFMTLLNFYTNLSTLDIPKVKLTAILKNIVLNGIHRESAVLSLSKKLVRFVRYYSDVNEISQAEALSSSIKILNSLSEDNWNTVDDLLQMYVSLDKVVAKNFKFDFKELGHTHDDIVKLIEIRKNEALDKEIEYSKEEIITFNFSTENVVFYPAKKPVELVEIGQSLRNCVRSYIDRVINKKIYIIAAKDIKTDEYVACIEYSFDRKAIVQFKGKCNNYLAHDTEYNKDCIEYLNHLSKLEIAVTSYDCDKIYDK